MDELLSLVMKKTELLGGFCRAFTRRIENAWLPFWFSP
jgi:hypothetical protein